jgi:hypothetical protein
MYLHPERTMAWRLTGEYVESCSCELFCPCLLGPRDTVRAFPSAIPTAGHCDILAVFHVDSGTFDTIDLADLTILLAIHIPGRMSDGDWRVAPYLPEEASPEQRAALERIFTGREGGPMARVATVVTEWAPPHLAPIAYAAQGLRRRVTIPGLLGLDVEGLVGVDGRKEIWIDNLKHMASRLLACAVGRRARYEHQGRRWDHDGKNAHYGPFAWAG